MQSWLENNWRYLVVIILALGLLFSVHFWFTHPSESNVVFEPIMTESEYYKTFPNTEFPYDAYKTNEMLRRCD